jgi:3-oxoacyl-[acyl-carrier protein] reductase
VRTLDGKVALVTGGARGIGRAYSLGLAREGAAIALADINDASETARLIEAEGGIAQVIRADVRNQTDTERMAAEAVGRFGRIDILVNNAGHFRYAKRGPFHEIPVDEWDEAFRVNVRGTWLCARAVFPTMKAQGSGRIINVSSQTVWKGKEGFLHYVSSKAAVIGLTRALATEIGGDGIAVNTVVPEYIPHDLEYAVDLPQIDQKVVAQRVFKRTQTPEDMVGIVVFLAGPGADFITGQSFLVNGGSGYQ